MNFENLKSVYFIGIGGIGMSAIARYFHAHGKEVAGYDKTPTPLTDELILEGIEVHFEDNPDAVNNRKLEIENCLVVYTPAVPKDHKELNYFLRNGFTVLKRSQVLGLITQNHFTIAVAGTHGKTTTSSMIAHILRSSGINCTAFLGGISKNYNTNLLLPAEPSKPSVVVVEADEYDRSFLTLHPDIAVITSMDADHLDIYGDKNYMEDSYRLFAQQVKEKGVLISRIGLPVGKTKSTQKQYSLSDPADYTASGIEIKNHQYYFNWVSNNCSIENLATQMPGRHNVENVVAAIAVAKEIAIADEKIYTAVHSYAGVRRRFDYQVKTDSLVFIDDYAHHPEELRACISSVRELYPDKKITGIFQPHLFTRTRDFADGFAKSLSLLDELILLDIYPARELPIPGVTSELILGKVSIPNKTLCRKADVMGNLNAKKIEVLLTLGAGDIDQLVEPIKKLLIQGSKNPEK
ncbi:MAG: UDP-N-acetylmuramate--L-alanine ligase [Bacteroidota bacterium]